jgi:hypothetical protein
LASPAKYAAPEPRECPQRRVQLPRQRARRRGCSPSLEQVAALMGHTALLARHESNEAAFSILVHNYVTQIIRSIVQSTAVSLYARRHLHMALHRRHREAFSIATTRSHGRRGNFRAPLFFGPPPRHGIVHVCAGHMGDPSPVSSSSSSDAHSPHGALSARSSICEPEAAERKWRRNKKRRERAKTTKAKEQTPTVCCGGHSSAAYAHGSRPFVLADGNVTASICPGYVATSRSREDAPVNDLARRVQQHRCGYSSVSVQCTA